MVERSADIYMSRVSNFLFLTPFSYLRSPRGSLPGGNAESFDWSLLHGVRLEKPWLLAGGLEPGNVARAIAIADPTGVAT